MDTTIEFDLPADRVHAILAPDWSGPLGALGRRLGAGTMERMTQKLARPTKITVSDAGIRVAAAGTERQIDWSSVRAVNERTAAWVFQLAPSGICFIPAEAVPAPQRADFSAQLRAVAGSKYKVRQGGMRQP